MRWYVWLFLLLLGCQGADERLQTGDVVIPQLVTATHWSPNQGGTISLALRAERVGEEQRLTIPADKLPTGSRIDAVVIFRRIDGTILGPELNIPFEPDC